MLSVGVLALSFMMNWPNYIITSIYFKNASGSWDMYLGNLPLLCFPFPQLELKRTCMERRFLHIYTITYILAVLWGHIDLLRC